MARGTFFAGCLQVGAVVLLGTTCGSFPGRSANAAVLLSSPDEIYRQTFDSLAGQATGWTNDSTLPGWSLYVQNATLGSVAAPRLARGSGTSKTGSFYAFGSAPTTSPCDIALGGVGSGGDYFNKPASGAVAGWIALAVTNNTGGELASFTVDFTGEQWRDGGNASSQAMQLQYGFGSTFASVGQWAAPGGNFDWTSPRHAATATELDGNAAANRVPGLGGTIRGLHWADNSTLWLRWVENNDLGSDHGLAIDDFTFTATVARGSWQTNGDGMWSNPDHWNGDVPNAPGSVAVFGSEGLATTDGTVTLDVPPPTVGELDFDNARHRYTLGGTTPEPLTLQSAGGSAIVRVLSGKHEIAAPLALAGPTTITVHNAGDELMISGEVRGGSIFAKDGDGQLVLSAAHNHHAGTEVRSGVLTITSTGGLPAGSSLSIGAAGTVVLARDISGHGLPASGAPAKPVPEPGIPGLLMAAAGTWLALHYGPHRAGRRRMPLRPLAVGRPQQLLDEA